MTTRREQQGFTLVETAIAAALSLVIVVGVVMFTQVGERNVSTVRYAAKASKELRTAAELVADDLRQCETSHMTIVSLADGNHSVTLQRPIGVTAGTPTWGIYEASLGATTAQRSQAGWSVCYTVVDDGAEKQLVRRTLDAGGAVRKQEVLLRNLRPGSSTAPGFQVEANGAMWTITISTRRDGEIPMQQVQFDVSLRN